MKQYASKALNAVKNQAARVLAMPSIMGIVNKVRKMKMPKMSAMKMPMGSGRRRRARRSRR